MALRQTAWWCALVWAAGVLVMGFGALSVLASGYVDGQYLPSHADAFYHGRRILDAVMTGKPVIQFDPLIHAPEGSWLTWPWGYDQALASAVSLFGPFDSEQQAMRILAHMPLLFIPIVIGLMVLLTRQLRMSLWMSVVAVLAFAAVPLNFMRYSVGNLDHHFAEQLWALLVLNCGMWILNRQHNRAAPVALGVVLGTGVAVHNGLFVLPVLVVAGLGLVWLRGLELPQRQRFDALALTLVGTTLAMCIPSAPWRHGMFDYGLLSWFHLYVAACCAVYIAWMGRARVSTRTAAFMVVIGLLMLLPVYAQVSAGSRYVGGYSEAISDVLEAQSPYRVIQLLGAERTYRTTTWLIWLAGPAMLFAAWLAWRIRSSAQVFFGVLAVAMLALMQFQLRFGVFGAMALVILPALATDMVAQWRPRFARVTCMSVTLAYVVAFLPIQGFFAVNWVPGGDLSYAALRTSFQRLREACETEPGLALAPTDAGHWIRYHTGCSVISNVFLLTPQHYMKTQEEAQLLAMAPDQLRAVRPDIRYVVAYVDVERAILSGLHDPDAAQLQAAIDEEPRLVRELLRNDPAPSGYRAIAAAATGSGDVFARVYKIEASAVERSSMKSD